MRPSPSNILSLALAVLTAAPVPALCQAHARAHRIIYTRRSGSIIAAPHPTSVVLNSDRGNTTQVAAEEVAIVTLRPTSSLTTVPLPMSPGTSIVASGTSSQEALPTSTLALTSQKLQGARWPRPLKLGSTQTDYTSWAADGGLIVMGSVGQHNFALSLRSEIL